MCIRVGLEVRQGQVRVAPFQQGALDGGQLTWTTRREVVGIKPVQHGLELGVGIVEVVRIITARLQRLHFVHVQTEDGTVFGPRLFSDLDVGSIQRPDGDCTVECHLHVAGTGCFITCSRDLLGDICCRDQLLGQTHAIVRHEHHFQLALDTSIVVDPIRQLVDGIDDVFGQLVTGRRFGAEDKHAWVHVIVRVGQQTTIKRHDVNKVQLLALVLVQTLDLNVKDRLGTDIDTCFLFDDLDQLLFVVTLDGHELLLERLVVGKFHHATQFVQLQRPLLAHHFVVETSQFRVARQQPATRCHPVGHVAHFFRPQLGILGEEIFLHQLGVDLGHTIHFGRTDHAQVAHANLAYITLFDDGELGLDGIVARPLGLHQLVQEAGVDLVNHLQMARQYFLEQADRPLLQRFRQQSVVGIRENLIADSPSGIPVQIFLVNQHPHQFRDGDSRVSIVELNGNLRGKVAEVTAMDPLVAAHDVLDGASTEEVLLDQTQLFTCIGLIVRIQHLGDGLGLGFLSLGVDVTTGVEHVPVEKLGGAGFPQTQDVDGMTAKTDHRNIPRHPFNLATGVPYLFQAAIVTKHGLDVAIERHFLHRLGTADLPGVAIFTPGVRTLDLAAILDFLTEQTVFVVDTVTNRRIVQSGQRVDKAGSQTTQAAVAKCHVRLLFAQVGQFQTEFAQRLFASLVEGEVVQVVGSQSSHQEFSREIVNRTSIFLEMSLLSAGQALVHLFIDSRSSGFPPRFGRGFLFACSQGRTQVTHDTRLELIFIQLEILVCLLLGSHKPYSFVTNKIVIPLAGPALLLSQNMYRRENTN